MISALHITNVKGVTGEFTLTPCTIIHGRNSTGKSAILDAIILWMLGYHPALGNKVDRTAELASGSIMSVTAGRRSVEWRSKGGKWSASGLDSLPDVPGVMLDINLFLGLSGPARAAYVLQNAGCPETLEEEVESAILTAAVSVTAVHNVLDAARRSAPTTPDFLVSTKAILQAEVARLQKDIVACEAESLKLMTGAAEQQTSVLRQDPTQKLNEARSALSRKRGVITAQQTRWKTAQDKLRSIRDQIAQADGLAGLPGMKQRLSEAEELRLEVEAKITSGDATLAKLREKVSGLLINKSRLSSVKEVMDERLKNLVAHGRCDQCGTEGAMLDGAIGNLKRDSAATASELEAAAKIIESEQDQMASLKRDLSQWRVDHAEYLAGITRHRTAIDALLPLEGKLAELKRQELVELEVPAPDESVASEAASLAETIKALEFEHRQHVARLATDREISKLAKRKSDDLEEKEKISGILKVVTQQRDRLVKEVMDPLTSAANLLITPVIGKALVYNEEGLNVEGHPLRILSGSEQMVVFAGIQAAICRNTPERILLMDELGRVDAERKRLLLQTVLGLVDSGFIEQFIGVDSTNDLASCTDPKLSVINVS